MKGGSDPAFFRVYDKSAGSTGKRQVPNVVWSHLDQTGEIMVKID